MKHRSVYKPNTVQVYLINVRHGKMAPWRLEIYIAECFTYSVLKQVRCQSSQLGFATQLAINYLKIESRTFALQVSWDTN